MIRDTELQIKLKNLTLKRVEELIEHQQIMGRYREHAPFTWDLLYIFAAATK